MTNDPTTVGGTLNGNILYVITGAGSGTNGATGFTYSGGIATFLDDSNSSGNQGIYSGDNTQSAWLQGSSNYTFDMKMQMLGTSTGGNGGQKDMSFWSSNGRGLRFDVNGNTNFVSSGPIAPTGSHANTAYDTYRVIVDAGGSIGPVNTIYIYYSSDGDVNNGNADNVLLTSTTMGGSGWFGGSTVGFALGSTGGSSTTNANYNLDWVRVVSGSTGVDAVYTPDPASLALLALGAIPMMIRRRRAA
jgi:hypothetical protein